MMTEPEEITDAEEKRQLLLRSSLGIMAAGMWKPGGIYVTAAHAADHSLFLLKLDNGKEILHRVRGGTKDQRKAVQQRIEARLTAKWGA